MEASRVPPPTPHPLDDPAVRAAQQERIRVFVNELEAEMTPEELAESDRIGAELMERAKHWPA